MHKPNSSHQLAAQQEILPSGFAGQSTEISKFCPAAMMGATQYVVVEPTGREPRIRRRSRFELASRTLNIRKTA